MLHKLFEHLVPDVGNRNKEKIPYHIGKRNLGSCIIVRELDDIFASVL
jgi:hypothetical protein